MSNSNIEKAIDFLNRGSVASLSNLDRDLERVKATLMLSAEEDAKCVICDKVADARGIHRSGKNDDVPKGRMRLIIYGICTGCVNTSGAANLIQERIEATLHNFKFSEEDR